MYQEELIKKLREFKNQDNINYFKHNNSIKDGFFISNYKKYVLKERTIYENSVKLTFPIDFLDSENEFSNKLFNQDYTFFNKDRNIIFMFKIYDLDINLLKQDIINEINAVYKDNGIEEILLEKESKKILALKFYNDIKRYNVYFIELDNRVLIFNTIYEKYQSKELKTILDEIALTINKN